jgi:hypothetical protein
MRIFGIVPSRHILSLVRSWPKAAPPNYNFKYFRSKRHIRMKLHDFFHFYSFSFSNMLCQLMASLLQDAGILRAFCIESKEKITNLLKLSIDQVFLLPARIMN